jgi:hypothetical protein
MQKVTVVKPHSGFKPEWHNTLHLAASAADTTYVSALGLAKDGQSVTNTFFQATAGVQVFFTLDHADRATDPDSTVQANVLWSPALAVPVGGNIVQAPYPFTALKIVFSGPSELHIMVA